MSTSVNTNIDWTQLQWLQREARSKGWQCVVGAVIFSPDNKIFVQKRSPDKQLFSNCWDVIGGHVEEGESLQEALRREIQEETGWELRDITHFIQQVDWSVETRDLIVNRREFDFVVTVDGDLTSPQIEADNFTEYRWISPDEIALLEENREADDAFTLELVKQAFQLQK